MNKSEFSKDIPYTASRWEKVLAYFSAIFIIILSSYLVIRNEPFSDANLVVIVRVNLAIAIAILGATIPGFLHIDWKVRGVAIRAGGALGLFIFAYWYTPDVINVGAKYPESLTAGFSELIVHSENRFEDIRGREVWESKEQTKLYAAHFSLNEKCSDNRISIDKKGDVVYGCSIVEGKNYPSAKRVFLKAKASLEQALINVDWEAELDESDSPNISYLAYGAEGKYLSIDLEMLSSGSSDVTVYMKIPQKY